MCPSPAQGLAACMPGWGWWCWAAIWVQTGKLGLSCIYSGAGLKLKPLAQAVLRVSTSLVLCLPAPLASWPDLRCATAAPHLAAGCWAGAGYPTVPGPTGAGRALPAWGPIPAASASPPAAPWHPGLQSSPVPFSKRHQKCKKNVS